jgi:dihydropyrimidinase
MNEFVAATSTNIAKILNIYPRKGAILPGADADLVVFDPTATKTIRAATQKSAIDYNVFEGIELTGLPVVTISRGKVAYRNGEVRAETGAGRFVERPAGPAPAKALSTWKELTAPRRIERSGIPAGV